MRWMVIAAMIMAGCAFCENLNPTFLKPGKVIYLDNFNDPGELDTERWQLRQKTRWTIEGDVLKGIPSTPEYQKMKKATGKGHTGTVPRINMIDVPADYILAYRFMLEGGKASKLVPLVEFGHHVSRVYFSDDGPRFLADHEKLTLDQIDGKTIEDGTWYNVLVEVAGDAIVVQIEGWGTLKGQNEFLGKTERPTIGFTGKTNGNIYLDDVKLTAVK
jgi:hypothetical protein